MAISAVLVSIYGTNINAQGSVNCATARADIAHLEHEKKSNVERVAKGVMSIMPIGLVLNTVRGTEKGNLEIATGEYNDKIDARIAEIKRSCGV